MAWLAAHGPIRDLVFKGRNISEAERNSLMIAWNPTRYMELIKPRVGIQDGDLKELLSVEVVGGPDQMEIEVVADKFGGQREEGSFVGRNSLGAKLSKPKKGDGSLSKSGRSPQGCIGRFSLLMGMTPK